MKAVSFPGETAFLIARYTRLPPKQEKQSKKTKMVYLSAMMKKSILLLLLCLSGGTSLFAALVRGRVTDQNGKPLPFATIFIKGTSIGTSANGDGVYALELKAGSYAITCQYMGYESVTQTITIAGTDRHLDFQLAPREMEMEEIVVQSDGEDPAYTIMRKVIEKRKYHAGLVQHFESDIYLKGVVRSRDFPEKILGQKVDLSENMLGLDSSGKGILYLLEERSHYAFRAPDQQFTKVLSVRQSGDPQGLGFATMPPVINIYDNNIRMIDGLNDRGFISPANSNAFHYYDFKFLGSYFEDDRMIDKIKVTPKRKYEPCFSGYVYVVDGEWVFKSVDLLLTHTAQINLLDTFRLKQYYRPIDEGIWIIQNQVMYLTLGFMGIDLVGNFLTSYDNQVVNQPLPDDLFDDRIIGTYAPNARNHNPKFWDSIRPVPLDAAEIRDFKLKDSLYTVQKQKSDSLFHTVLYQYDFVLSGFGINFQNHRFHIRPLITAIGFNSVEGLNATLDMNYEYSDSARRLRFRLLNRYGFSNHHYNPLLKAIYTHKDTAWLGKKWTIGLTAGQYVFQINPRHPIDPLINEWYTLLGGKNYMKLFENRLAKIDLSRDWGNGWYASLSLSYEQRRSLVNTTNYTFADPNDERITPNRPAGLPPLQHTDAAIAEATIRYQPGWKYIQYPDYKMPVSGKQPVFSLHYTKGFPGVFQSTADFDKWQFELQHQFQLRMLGRLDYRLVTGGFLNKRAVNLPDYQHITGNQTFLAGPLLHSFQLAPYYRFSNLADLYFQGHAEWHLGGLLTNKIPLFRRLNWFLIAGSNVLYVDRKDYYAEVFVGLENIGYGIFRLGRVDFIAGYESGREQPSLGLRIRLSGIVAALLGGDSASLL